MTISNIQKLYTRVIKMGGTWDTYLQIDHQGFRLAHQVKNKKDAQWLARMMAIALKRMIESNQKSLTSSKS